MMASLAGLLEFFFCCHLITVKSVEFSSWFELVLISADINRAQVSVGFLVPKFHVSFQAKLADLFPIELMLPPGDLLMFALSIL